ncbi:hypothetical protein Ahy_B10g101359 [Arachis hypogaea]|uniref:Uncharacterized protein n=1 Tax=Arachis hypogaea TaxID=3818 RepID=A0A444WZE5_ARAHY|nr:hypothetical protein Ahy_B10g101359 [Arachis hypogaea]
MILMNTGLIGKKEISTLIYRMPVAVAISFTYKKMHIKSDQHVSMMFSYHRSIESIYSMELCVKLQDVEGSSSSSNNMEEMQNSGAGRARSPSFNTFVAPAQNTEIPDRRPFPNVHVAYPEGMADGLADSSEEDEIENDSGEEAEVVPKTQLVQGERVIPIGVESINVAKIRDVFTHFRRRCPPTTVASFVVLCGLFHMSRRRPSFVDAVAYRPDASAPPRLPSVATQPPPVLHSRCVINYSDPWRLLHS